MNRIQVRSLFSLLFFIVISNYVYPQAIDSLKNLLSKTFDRKQKVDLYIQISRDYEFVNYDSLMYYADEAYKESVADNYLEGEICALQQKCLYYMNKGDNQTAHRLIEQAEILAEQTGDKILLGVSYLIHGDIYANTKINDEAFRYYTFAKDIFKQQGSSKQEDLSLNRIGILKYEMNDIDGALEIFEKVNEAAAKRGDYDLMLISLNNIAGNMTLRGKIEEALKVYMTSAKMYQEKLKSGEIKKNLQIGASNYANIAISHASLGDTISALLNIDTALTICQQSQDLMLLSQIMKYKGDLLLGQKKYQEALQYLNEVYAVSERSNWSEIAMKSAQSLSQIYKNLGDIKTALDYQEKFIDHFKVVESTGNNKKMTELQFKYDFEKEKLLMEEQSRRKNLIIISILILTSLIIALIFTLFIHMRTRATKAILQHKNLLLEKDKLKLEQQNMSKELELRNKEIATNVMMLQKKNDLLASMANKLVKAKAQFTLSNKIFIESCIRELKENSEETLWQNFEVQFNNVYESFYQKLDEINPDLTLNDRRLCAYLRMKMTTKEIASITNLNVRSVEVARYRLRKKLKISDPSISLSVFLEHL